MRYSILPLIVLLVLPSPGRLQDKGREKQAALAIGLSPAEVRARLGPPARISRQVFAHRAREQWHYPAPDALRLEFDCPRGQIPRLVQSSAWRAPRGQS